MLNTIFTVILSVFLFLFPLYSIPIDTTGFESDKKAILLFFSLMLFFLTLAKIFFQKKVTVFKTLLDLPFLLLTLSFFVSSTMSVHKSSAFFSPFTLATMVALTLLYFSLTQYFNSQKKNIFDLFPLFLSGTLVSLVVLVGEMKIIPQSYLSPAFLTYLSLGNNQVTLSAFLLVITILAFGAFVGQKKLAGIKRILLIITTGVTSTTVIFLVFHLVTDRTPIFLPYWAGWTILMEAGKNFKTFITGVGPGNFLSAYLLSKPAALNTTPLWNILFTSSSSSIMTLLIEVGLFGFLAFCYLFINTIRAFQKNHVNSASKYFIISLIGLFLYHFFFTTSVTLLITLTVLLAYAAPKIEASVRPSVSAFFFRFRFVLTGISILSLASVFYFSARIYSASLFYRMASTQVQTQKREESLASIRTSLSLNPYDDAAYVLASTIHLLMVDTVKPGEAPSVAREIRTGYVQSAIDYGRKAVELDRYKSENWAHLAQVYQILIPTTPEAKDVALESYNQQLFLDKSSPQPRLAAGKLLAQLGDYDQSLQFLWQAANLKPDWNEAFFQIAHVYVRTGQFELARGAYEKALSVTSPDSQEYQTIKQEMDNLPNN